MANISHLFFGDPPLFLHLFLPLCTWWFHSSCCGFILHLSFITPALLPLFSHPLRTHLSSLFYSASPLTQSISSQDVFYVTFTTPVPWRRAACTSLSICECVCVVFFIISSGAAIRSLLNYYVHLQLGKNTSHSSNAVLFSLILCISMDN